MLSGSVIQAGDDIILVGISEHSSNPIGDYYSVHSYKNLSENVANISDDLRWRMVWAFLFHEEEISCISSRLYISEKSVHRFVDLYVSTGCVHPNKQCCVPLKKLSDHENVLRLDSMFDDSGIHLDELQTNLKHVFGTDVALSTLCNTVKNMGLTCHRLKHVALQ